MDRDGPHFVLHEVSDRVAELELFRREMQVEQEILQWGWTPK
jgi:hypothetical protein